MRKALLLGVAALLSAAATPASAQSLTFFFNTSFLDPLARSPLLLNLSAQSNKVAQADVNVFNDYFLINGPGRLRVNFNRQLQNKGQRPLPGWIGVAQYSNHEIFFDLQDGFQRVKANFNMPNARAGHVTVYKTLNTGQLVFDYAVQVSGNVCQEFLFTPMTGGFQRGLRVSCFETLGTMRAATAGSAGRM